MLTIAQRAFLFESDPSRPDYACLGAGFRGYLGASLWPTGRLQEQFRHNPVHHAATNYLQIAGYIAESIVGSDRKGHSSRGHPRLAVSLTIWRGLRRVLPALAVFNLSRILRRIE